MTLLTFLFFLLLPLHVFTRVRVLLLRFGFAFGSVTATNMHVRWARRSCIEAFAVPLSGIPSRRTSCFSMPDRENGCFFDDLFGNIVRTR
mmetsp:Transcript_20687/g.64336  ORF Transcript_20687/g.64336 Transcript_20687/m.64336 type:complete len:90 (-) Transcript_20687:79-348(-)